MIKQLNSSWDLIQFLPLNQALVSKLEDIASKSGDYPSKFTTWSVYFNVKTGKADFDYPMIAYILYVIKEYYNKISKEKAATFTQNFMLQQGNKFIIGLLNTIKENISEGANFTDSISTVKCLLYIMQLLKDIKLDNIFANLEYTSMSLWEDINWIKNQLLKANGNILVPADLLSLYNCVCKIQSWLIMAQPDLLTKEFLESYRLPLFFSSKNAEYARSVRVNTCTWIYTMWDTIIIKSTNREECEQEFLQLLIDLYLEHSLTKIDTAGEFWYLLMQLANECLPESKDIFIMKRNFSILIEALNRDLIALETNNRGGLELGWESLLKLVAYLMVHAPGLTQYAQGLYEALKVFLFGKIMHKKGAFASPKACLTLAKCKRAEVRKIALSILYLLITPELADDFISYFYLPSEEAGSSKSQLIYKTTWRTNLLADWQQIPQGIVGNSKLPISGLSYAGLKNLRNTCFMNSVLQQLYHISDFRNSLLSLDFKSSDPVEGSAILSLQHIFAMLNSKDFSIVNPSKLATAMKIPVGDQQDAQQFMLQLFDCVADSLKGTQQEKLLHNIFEWKTVRHTTCSKCNTETQKEEPSWCLYTACKRKEGYFRKP